MDLIAFLGVIVALLIFIWLTTSLFQFGSQSFDAAIMPKYPSAQMQELMNTATTNSYNVYPRLPPGTQLTNW